MDTNRLRQFCTVVEAQALRKASDVLNISHSGLSKSMKVLESDLGKDLFTPDGRGIRVTEFGLKVYEQAKLLLSAEEQFSSTIRGTKPQTRGISIGTFEVFSTYFLGEMFEKDFRGFELDIKELVPGHLEDAIASYIVDVGITYIPIPHPELDFLRVCSVDMGIFGIASVFQEYPWQDLPFCAPSIPVHGSPTNVKGLDGWPEATYPREVSYRVDMMETGLELCRRGVGVMYLPTFIAKLHNRFVYEKYKLDQLSAPFKVEKRDVFIVKRKSTVESHHIKVIAKNLRLICK